MQMQPVIIIGFFTETQQVVFNTEYTRVKKVMIAKKLWQKIASKQI